MCSAEPPASSVVQVGSRWPSFVTPKLSRRVAKALLRDLLERGLDPERARVFVIDGSKALRVAIRKTFDRLRVVQRCQIHKRRS